MTSQSRSWVCLDGNILPYADARISLRNSSYLRGLGLFETMLAVGQNVPLVELHLRRLSAACDHFELRCPDAVTLKTKLDQLLQLQREAAEQESAEQLITKLETGESAIVSSPETSNGALTHETAYRIRLTVSATSDDSEPDNAWFESPAQSQWSITVSPCQSPMQDAEQSIRAVVAPDPIAINPSVSGYKTTSYLPWIMSRRFAQQRNCDQAIVQTPDGSWSECSSANLFVVRQNQLMTPAMEFGGLPGIMRQIVIHEAKRLSIPLSECEIGKQDLPQIDFAFATNATQGIVRIATINDHATDTAPDWWPSLWQQVRVRLLGY